ncbi:MAG: diacylglycerol kinase family protein [Candidatus Ozemobacteraceae bacterium]
MSELAVKNLDIFLNQKAGRNSAATSWKRAEEALLKQGFILKVWPLESPEVMCRQVDEALASGASRLIAAGGDGTMQSLIDAVFQGPRTPEMFQRLAVGAIGLGTSNDFHKPFSPDHDLAGFPARIKEAGTTEFDVMELTGKTPAGKNVRHAFLQASHAGTIPVTNETLTSRPGFFKWLYGIQYELALGLTSFYTLFAYPGFEGEVQIGTEKQIGKEEQIGTEKQIGKEGQIGTEKQSCSENFSGWFSGMTILKQCSIAGFFTFATKRTRNDGLFDVGLCKKVGPFKLMDLTWKFSSQGFGGLPEVVFREAREVQAKFAHPQPIDFDGELVTLISASWRLLPQKLNILG